MDAGQVPAYPPVHPGLPARTAILRTAQIATIASVGGSPDTAHGPGGRHFEQWRGVAMLPGSGTEGARTAPSAGGSDNHESNGTMRIRIPVWRRFLDGVPDYLARNYWWAYLWRPAVWFFDHQPIINLVLFGQYKRLLKQALRRIDSEPTGRLLQLTCAYGCLTPCLVDRDADGALYVCDVASVQLIAVRDKLKRSGRRPVPLAQMNAEHLAFEESSFNTVLVFFLLHELPADARRRVLAETVRVVAPGGRIVVVEYAPFPAHHFLCRLRPVYRMLTRWEPFLEEFWHEDVGQALVDVAAAQAKSILAKGTDLVFDGFYRVAVYQVMRA